MAKSSSPSAANVKSMQDCERDLSHLVGLTLSPACMAVHVVGDCSDFCLLRRVSLSGTDGSELPILLSYPLEGWDCKSVS